MSSTEKCLVEELISRSCEMNGFRRKVVLNSGWSLMKVVFHQGSFTSCRVPQMRVACGPQRPRVMLKELTLFSFLFFLLFYSF